MNQDTLSARPVCCPYCGNDDITYIENWAAVSNGDHMNTVELDEYQCEECNFSFWV